MTHLPDRARPARMAEPPGAGPGAPYPRSCTTCGATFITTCFPRVHRRTDGTETVRWVASEVQCARCQPSLPFGEAS